MIFTVELAGVPIRVHCRYEENRDFLRDYLTDRDPVLTVEPTEEDCRRIRLGLDRKAAPADKSMTTAFWRTTQYMP